MKTCRWNHIFIYSTHTYICDMYMHVHRPQRNLNVFIQIDISDKVGLPSTKHKNIKNIYAFIRGDNWKKVKLKK